MKKFLITIFLLGAAIIGGLAMSVHWVGNRPLASADGKPFSLNVRPGASINSVSRLLADRGAVPHPLFFVALVRAIEPNLLMKPGRYRVSAVNSGSSAASVDSKNAKAPATPQYVKPVGNLRELIDKLASGDREASEVTFVEGTRFRDMKKIISDLADMSPVILSKGTDEILTQVGVDPKFATHPEGLFFPDTYQFDDGSTDLDLLKRAHSNMMQKLNDAWIRRDPNIPLKTPYDMLILASIIEKETGAAAERPTIASVFYNRMAINMRLQTDPTVIYGMGEEYQGNIRKKDLQTDTPYNTYTRHGLPPTPIALPGMGSLMAAARPAQTNLYYFVGKGDGTHHFSKTLEEHNRAVAKYQLGR
jgi:UPF0755 protein